MTAIRQPALYLFVLACAAALAADGRVSLRLLFDTAITLAALPAFQLIALAVVYWTGRRPVGFATAIDQFFANSWPLFLVFATLGLFGASVSPVTSVRWFDRLAVVLVLAALAMTIRLDFGYYRHALQRSATRAGMDLVLQRAIAWTATVLYIAGTALPKAGTLGRDIAVILFGARA